jgi:hypothetical protein
MHKHFITSALLLSLCLPAAAHAGRVFGDIKLDGKPLPAGVPVTITRVLTVDGKAKNAEAPSDTTKTDQYGAYKLTVKETGKCVLTVAYDKQTAKFELFSNKEATRYDLILEKKDGKLSLRRK